MSDPFDSYSPSPSRPAAPGPAPAPTTNKSLGKPDGEALVRWIPLFQGIAIIAAALIIVMMPHGWWDGLSWILGAILVPVLWALFYAEDKKRQIASQRLEKARGAAKLNQVLFWVGLAVGLYAGFLFALEIAK